MDSSAQNKEALKNSTSLDIGLHGLSCRLESGWLPFMTYARSYLFDLLSEPVQYPDLSVRLHWNSTPGDRWQQTGVVQRGRRLFQEGSRLLISEIFEVPGLQLEIKWAGAGLEVDAFYLQPSYLKRLVLGESARQRLYAVLVYYLFYFPVIRLLYDRCGFHLVHAGGAVRSDEALVFAGLPGSGKSTFMLSLLADPAVRLLSDNLLLYDSQRIYACPEPLHLGVEGLRAADPAVRGRLYDERRIYSHGRRDFRLNPDARVNEAVPSGLAFLALSDRLERNRLSSEQAVERLINYDRLAKETNAYDQFASALDLISPPGRQGSERNTNKQDVLRSLLSGLGCYELFVRKGAGVKDAHAQIWDEFTKQEAVHDNRQPADHHES
jgi:hypothetical protein